MGRLTKKVPKPLIKLRGKTILEIKLDEYIRQGFQEFIFCIGYRGDLIRKAVQKYEPRIQASFSDAGENASIFERLYVARELFDGEVLMTYGDTFTDIDLSQLIVVHREGRNEATIVTASIQNPFGLVETNVRGQVVSFREKPVLSYYIGYAVIRKSALNFAPHEIRAMPDGEGLVAFYRILMALEKLGAYDHAGLRISFNTPDELKRAEIELSKFYTMTEVQNDYE